MASTNTTTSTKPRFGPRILLIAGTVALVLWAAWVAGLVFAIFPLTDAARVTTSAVTGGTSTTSTSTVELPAAEFAVGALFALGPLFILVGTVIGLAEMTVPSTRTAAGPVLEGGPELAGAVVAGIPAVIGAAGDLAKSLSSGLKGLKTSVALVLVGTLLLIVGAAVAWQTIPGTNLSPSVTAPAPTAGTPAPTGSATPSAAPTS